MPSFGKTSKSRLETCDPRLQQVFNRVVEIADCSILEGHRGQALQDLYYKTGRSKVQWPRGKHNSQPSMAVDAAPWINGEVSWDHRHCVYFGGIVMGVAEIMGVKLRWGGDWDNDREPITDQGFQDLVHFELID